MSRRKNSILGYLKIPLRYGGSFSYLACILRLLGGVIPILEMALIAEFIDRVISIFNFMQTQGASGGSLCWGNAGAFRSIYLLIAVWAFLIALSWMSGQAESFVTARLTHRLRQNFRTHLTEKCARLPYACIENKEVQDRMMRVTKNPEKEIVDGFYQILTLAATGIRILGIIAIIASKIWWCGVAVLLLNLPVIYLSKKNGETIYKADKDISLHMRKYEYLDEVLSGRESAMERNIFAFTGSVQEMWGKQYDFAYEKYIKAFLSYFFAARLYGILSAVASLAMVLVLLKPLSEGQFTIGLFIAAVSQLLSVVSVMVLQFSGIVKQFAKKKEYMCDMMAFLEMEEEKSDVLAPPLKAFEGFETLEFEHVSFKYPGTDVYVIRDVSFCMKAGEHYAFVGENAAGKTTLTKLATGLYDSYEGRILVNGKELREYSVSERKSLYSIVYQDFAKYQIPVRDTIMLGDLGETSQEVKESRFRSLLERLRLEQLVQEMPEKEHTVLGKFSKKDAEVSLGQWQRFAIARALMKDAPICILDEPSASLDPVSESNMYREYGEISRGKTTIFISHRLGSVKLADKIFVFEKGMLLENGTFEELMHSSVQFKKMYEAQRSWYE